MVYLLSAGTCGLAVLGYAATRLIAFPMLADDVGNWAEPLGLVSVAAESVAVITAALAMLSDRLGRVLRGVMDAPDQTRTESPMMKPKATTDTAVSISDQDLNV